MHKLGTLRRARQRIPLALRIVLAARTLCVLLGVALHIAQLNSLEDVRLLQVKSQQVLRQRHSVPIQYQIDVHGSQGQVCGGSYMAVWTMVPEASDLCAVFTSWVDHFEGLHAAVSACFYFLLNLACYGRTLHN